MLWHSLNFMKYDASNDCYPYEVTELSDFAGAIDFQNHRLQEFNTHCTNGSVPTLAPLMWTVIESMIESGLAQSEISNSGIIPLFKIELVVPALRSGLSSSYEIVVSHVTLLRDGHLSTAFFRMKSGNVTSKRIKACVKSGANGYFSKMRYINGEWIVYEAIHLTSDEVLLLKQSICQKANIIAQQLNFTEACIKKRKKALCLKLNVDKFTTAICKAIHLGLIDLSDSMFH